MDNLFKNTFIFLNFYNPSDLILEEGVLKKSSNHLKAFHLLNLLPEGLLGMAMSGLRSTGNPFQFSHHRL